MKTFVATAAALAAGIAIAGCVVHQTDAPGLSGPSQLALTLTLTATPDSIAENGGDQSVIRITAIGPDGQPVPNVALRMDTLGDGIAFDIGTLSSKNLITNSSGVATVTFTAPAAIPGSFVGSCQGTAISEPNIGSCVVIRATPTASNFAPTSLQPQSVTVRMVPPGIILPPVKTPKAAFTFLPSSPLASQPVSFDASASCSEVDSTGACVAASTTSIVSYAWTFGDGGSGTGRQTTHAYSSGGTFVATLTVTNSTGGSASTSQSVTLTLPAGPTADFVVSPGSPAANNGVIFNADTSTAAPGHNIVQFSWNFGDPNATGAAAAQCGGAANSNTASTSQVCHVFTLPGTYNVTLSILDDTGQRAVSTKSVTVTP